MSVHSISGGDPDRSDVPPAEAQPAVEPAPASVFDLVNRTLADPARTEGAAKLVTSLSQGATRVIVGIGVVLIVGVVLVGTLIYFAGVGPAIGGGAAAGGVGAATVGYLWNRRAAKRKVATRRRS